MTCLKCKDEKIIRYLGGGTRICECCKSKYCDHGNPSEGCNACRVRQEEHQRKKAAKAVDDAWERLIP